MEARFTSAGMIAIAMVLALCGCKRQVSENTLTTEPVAIANTIHIDTLDFSMLARVEADPVPSGTCPRVGVLVYINSCECELCELEAVMTELDNNPDFSDIDRSVVIRVSAHTDREYLKYCLKSLRGPWTFYLDEGDLFLKKHPFIDSSEMSQIMLTMDTTVIKIINE